MEKHKYKIGDIVQLADGDFMLILRHKPHLMYEVQALTGPNEGQTYYCFESLIAFNLLDKIRLGTYKLCGYRSQKEEHPEDVPTLELDLPSGEDWQMVAPVLANKCECGAEKCRLPYHSTWCPAYEKAGT